MPHASAAVSLGGAALLLVGALAPLDGQGPADSRDREALAAEACPPGARGVLFGLLHDATTGTALPGGTVHVTWREATGVSDTTARRRRAQADHRGLFTFCDPPTDVRLTLGARVLDRHGHPEDVVLAPGDVRRQDVEVRFGQISGGVAGRLVDAGSGEPIAAATLQVPEARLSALTDSRGRFTLDDLAVGDYRAEVRHVAYGRQSVRLEVHHGQTTHVRVELHPRAIELDPLAVTVAVRPRWLESRGFYERRERGLGSYVGPEDLERQEPQRLNEILRRMEGLHLRQVCTPYCYYTIATSGRTSLDACPPQFYVDGTKVWTPLVTDLDALAHADDVAAVEVYRGIAQTPAQFFGKCGSVVIWTKRASD